MEKTQPLAARMRPLFLDDYVGQAHLLGKGAPLRLAIEKKYLHSLILWGPPGTGKTSLAYLIAESMGAAIEKISAVLAGVKEIRAVLEAATLRKKQHQQATLVFVDEIHRFNKAQQDAFLPAVESGLITLLGATTENPSFSLNNALLSRLRVYVLEPLSPSDLKTLIGRTLSHPQSGLGQKSILLETAELDILVAAAEGDARHALNLLEMSADLAEETPTGRLISKEILNTVIGGNLLRFDRGGDYFYDLISALHKSVRGSDPDASLYWLLRMLRSGADPAYLARRMLRIASEDIGNADPRALEITLNAWQVLERLGPPEGELALSQAILYLAAAPKSNAVYLAHQRAEAAVQKNASLPVPLHLRNAPTALMKSLHQGENYRYPHDEPHAFAPGVSYFPEKMTGEKSFYTPTHRGLEKQIQEKLIFLKSLN